MKKKLEMLEELQDVDLSIDALKTAQGVLQQEIDGMSQGVVAAKADIAEMNQSMAQLEAEKVDLDITHAAELENISRSETNMKEIKTNKEFQAVGREITAAKKQVSEIEEQVLLKIGEIEELSAKIAEKTAQLDELVQNSGQRIAEKEAEIGKVQSDIDTAVVKRDVVVKSMPASLVKKFTMLREQRRGQALAIAKDGYCVGCNMHLPPQLYNSLFKAEELLSCPHCQRILILKSQPQL